MELNKNCPVALYLRLSVDDDSQNESSSISSQKALLSQHALAMGMNSYHYYIDDGFSGTNFERPGFLKMIEDIESGIVKTVITKDLSRLGRDYLKTGYYTEVYFPDKKVRYIAINDNVDSAKGHDDFIPFKNIINEWYAKDISRKVKSALKAKAKKGEYLSGIPLYGYKKNPDNKHKLIIEQEEALIVKRIYNMVLNGITPYSIATILKKDKILTPRAKMALETGKYQLPTVKKYPYDWSERTVRRILQHEIYLGHLVYGKTTSASFKSKKVEMKKEEDYIVVKNTHEPIIDGETFNQVKKNVSIKKFTPKDKAECQIFAGLLRCPDCGAKITFSRKLDGKSNGRYACNTYRQRGKGPCTMHFISYDNLYKIVLTDIQKHAMQAKIDSERLYQQLIENSKIKNKKEQRLKELELNKINRRIEEINMIIKKIYEDNVLGKLTDSRYSILYEEYEAEQSKIKERAKILKEEIEDFKNSVEDINRFIQIVEKYVDLKALNASILNELIDKIIIHEREYIEGTRTQKIEIYYRFLNNLIN